MHEKGPNFCECGQQDPLVSLHWTYSREGYLKNKVNSEPIRDLEHQNQVIKRNIDELKEDPELLNNVMYEITTPIEGSDGYFEYRRWGKFTLAQKLGPFSCTRHYKAIQANYIP